MAGQDRFEVMRGGFYRGSRASALVFDVTTPETFENLLRWRKEILDAVQEQPFLVIGNKIDLERGVPQESARMFAESISAPYLETSALTGEGVPGLFEVLAQRAWGQGT
jgi:small GTP-binding protein